MRRLTWLFVLVGLNACAPVIEEEVILAEPIVEEPAPTAAAKGSDLCEEVAGDDGIGGTGCPAEP